ncbi:EndoU domain-containing protein [Nostoc sp. FACHB-152]|uniref:EndoU domain-containing protein n=1 Tax=unclassified Nostoc TaxID=2593658 RepID=UPI0016852B0A|nr:MULTISPECIES: EndoU domain-containing protein [unclassified Nostoc]MBD2445963.1 EndoU domain-containing protein [Nostoc sp. FACHB-152]MBD2467194.1 EndoU domain-containing protein [Nostoc sp. FACHB-145]
MAKINLFKKLFNQLNLLVLAGLIAFQNASLAQSQPTQLLPFFDNIDNPVPVSFPRGQQLDITPKPPSLNAFDEAVLKTCGAIGSKVNPAQFKQLLSSYPEVLQKIRQATGGELRPGRRKQDQFLEDLTNIWSKRRAFEHIFCGEIYNANDIGGLHFSGRYLQLQQQGVGGRLPNNQNREEVVPGVIYTLGVVIQQGNRRVTDVIKGYGYLSNAEEILIDATRAFKRQGNKEGACIYNVRDQETRTTFPTVFVRKEKAIVTFYPDATPQGARCSA